MRKWMSLFLLVCLLVGLCGCAGKAEVPPALEFRGISWNAAPEDVFEALGMDMSALDRGGIQRDPMGEHFTVVVPDWEIFGERAVTAYFRFDNFTPDASDYFGFSGLQIFYPESCDRENLVDNVRKCYGPEAREYALYSIVNGQTQAWKYAWKEGDFSWFSKTLAEDVLSDQGKAAYRSALGEVSDEAFEACLKAPAARIHWVEDYYGQFESPEDLMTDAGRVSWLNLNGGTMVHLLQKYEHMQ